MKTISRPHLVGLGETKTVKVKPHERTIRQRIYQLICKKCDRAVTRPTFGPCPKYCLECSPPKVAKKKPLDSDMQEMITLN
jgi:hypothetical protein